ncbi:MAG: dCTP deaminase [Candidatus Omnitrophica bacterium]|nr:dCTP deaminase [Candidatus Omnitrophota bacterium]
MSLKSDSWIRELALTQRMIEPFSEHESRPGMLSYGLSSYGYDMRLADEFEIYDGAPELCIDPKQFAGGRMRKVRTMVLEIPPNSFALGRSWEYFRIPREVLTLCLGKSSYARCGIIVNVTPFEPGWEGYATLSIVNATPSPARVYSGEGIAQVIFLEGDAPCQLSYAERKGRYQATQTIQHVKT